MFKHCFFVFIAEKHNRNVMIIFRSGQVGFQNVIVVTTPGSAAVGVVYG